MSKIVQIAVLGVCAALVGCISSATTITDMNPIGNDTYLVGGTGGTGVWTGNEVKVSLLKAASSHCKKLGKEFLLVSDTAEDGSTYKFASAEIKFRCVAAAK
ncbi:MAG: hypothetical protein ACN6O3_06335 [Comamonas sp.]